MLVTTIRHYFDFVVKWCTLQTRMEKLAGPRPVVLSRRLDVPLIKPGLV